MQNVATEKVPGGKLLRIKVNYDEKINDIKITGDFFIHPEESISEIENLLKNMRKDEEEENFAEKISKFILERDIQLIGIDPTAIARVLKAAMK
jgi:lipoate-protein ligase A